MDVIRMSSLWKEEERPMSLSLGTEINRPPCGALKKLASWGFVSFATKRKHRQ